jgi:mono/diheme cytochrome c family protein
MNFPIWESTYIGGGSWIALIAILHVYISHLAVGGGFFIWLTDRKAWRESSVPLHDYVRKHTWFFVYLTMVFGGVSGVGIWFIIALANPAGTDFLIHQFVFGWAIEWVFFVGEIVALLLYAYRFTELDRKARQVLSFLYAAFAWLSLFVINGILSFMLTPGNWLQTRTFWDGFFNPTFLPSLVFRTAMSIMIAGLFGYASAVFVRDRDLRLRLLRYSSLWLILPVPVGLASAYWYVRSLPGSVWLTAFVQNQQTAPFVVEFLITSVVLFGLGILLAIRCGLGMQRLATVLAVVIGLGWIGAFEYIREIARKPYLVSHHLFSNSILASNLEKLNQNGVLTEARWTAIKTVTADNQRDAGRELFNLQCLSCHTIGGIRNDILEHLSRLTYVGILSHLTGQGRLLHYMPPVLGTSDEKQALAVYLAELSGKLVESEPAPRSLQPIATAVLTRSNLVDKAQQPFLLLAWNDLGFQTISDSDAWLTWSPPGNTLEAQLVKCGTPPELAGEGVELTYRVESGFDNPAAHLPFWEHAASNFGKIPEKNRGLSGNGIIGKFRFDAENRSFRADGIPVAPYPDGGGFNPYPLVVVEARDTNSGHLLASTRVVAPVSTELGCRHCHGGDWRKDGIAGLSSETAGNILRAHDRINGTDLYRQARAGKPRTCQSCHSSTPPGAAGRTGVLNLSAAMHGWHANYMQAEGAQACAFCHPTAKAGASRCFRGIHAVAGLTCVKCHGAMNDHALSLLQSQADIPAAQSLMRHLTPSAAESKESIRPRTPWIQEPDCLNCHQDFQRPKSGFTGFNQWTTNGAALFRQRTDDIGIRCVACHGSTHAEYPALNAYHPARDNLQPLQYSGAPLPIGSNQSCEICHLEKKENSMHHDNMDRTFRNTSIWEKAINKASASTAGKP